MKSRRDPAATVISSDMWTSAQTARSLRVLFSSDSACLNAREPSMNEASQIVKTTWKRRLSTVCFLTAITVAMICRLSAFGWVAVAVANWLSA